MSEQHRTPERIWLVHFSEGEGWAWADDPNPDGWDPAPEAVEYVRAADVTKRLTEYVAQSEAERDRLKAELQRACELTEDLRVDSAIIAEEARRLADRMPDTSHVLARCANRIDQAAHAAERMKGGAK